MNFGALNYLTIVVYMGAMVAMGFWFSRQDKTSEEYLLGGRKMPWWAVGISYKISIISTISMVMIPGEIYNHGLTLFLIQILLPITSLIGFFSVYGSILS
jgi:SSS family solute:Na+ symporter